MLILLVANIGESVEFLGSAEADFVVLKELGNLEAKYLRHKLNKY